MNYPLTKKEKIAWDFAIERHHGQFRKFGNQSYFDAHVRKVNGILKQITTNEDLLCASILHDVCEDCGVTYYEIDKIFGKKVADLVQELTSSDKKIGKMGKKNYLLTKMINMSSDALLIKLCDRLQNISDHLTMSESFRKKYNEETRFIIDNLVVARQLNRKHENIISQINGILSRIDRGYKKKLKHLESFNR